MRVRLCSTVFGLMNNSAATPRVDMPVAVSSATRCSAGVSSVLRDRHLSGEAVHIASWRRLRGSRAGEQPECADCRRRGGEQHLPSDCDWHAGSRQGRSDPRSTLLGNRRGAHRVFPIKALAGRRGVLAGSYRPDIGRAAQRPARRRAAGHAADPAGARRTTRRTGPPCPDSGHHTVQPARLGAL